MDIDGAGETVEYRGQTFKAARYCVRKKMAEKDESEVEWHPQERWTHGMETRRRIWRARKFTGAPWGGSGDPDVPSTDLLRGNSGIRARGSSSDSPMVISLPDSPTLPVQLPSSSPLWVQLPPHVSSFDKNCTPSLPLVVGRGKYARLSYHQIHERYKKRG